MERIDISNKLVSLREGRGVGKNEQCRATGFTFVQLQRLETSSNNYKLPLVIKYLDCLGYVLYLTDGVIHKIINEYKDLPCFLKESRDGRFTTRSLAEAAGCSATGLNFIENVRVELHIDLLLKLCDVLGIEIQIKRKEA